MYNVKEIIERIHNNISNVIIGKDNTIKLIIITLLCSGHVLIEDVPGVGKTTMVSSLAKTLGLTFSRIQFTPDVLPSDVTGFTLYDIKSGKQKYQPGIIMNNIILADEINRTSPKTQSSLLEAMQESQITVDGTTYELPQPFMVLATQNPIDYIGTYPLPEAQLDRFLMKVSMGYPSLEDEISILNKFKSGYSLDLLEPVVSLKEVNFLKNEVSKVKATKPILEYITNIVRMTRDHNNLLLGVSPRGSLALLKTSQAYAMLNDRNYVLPDDVKAMTVPVLSHRLLLSPEAKLKQLTAERILKSILNSVYVPVIVK